MLAAVVAVFTMLGVGMSTAGAQPPPVDPTSTPTPSPSDDPSSEPVTGQEVLFNYPSPGQPDLGISEKLADLIDATPASETIRVSYFVMQSQHPVLDALLRAHLRGVRIQAVLDSGDGQKPKKNHTIDAAFAQLAEQLNSPDTTDGSMAMQCRRSCITHDTDSINHNKFVTFTRTGDASNVVFQSTGNLRVDGSGDSAYNAAVIIRGNDAVYDQYVAYFQDLAEQRAVPRDDYDAVRPGITSGAVTPRFFPRNDKGDTVNEAIRAANCATQPTTVRVMASYFSRAKVRNALRDIAYAGCTVQVLARQDTVSKKFCEKLNPSKVAIKIAYSPKKDHVTIHGKYVLINGSYSGAGDQAITWMGSHNFTDNALERNDETFVQFTDPEVNSQFAGNWERLWNDPAMSPGCSRANAKDNAAVEKSADTEVTKITRRAQTLSRGLPGKLRARQSLRPVQTVQGKRLRVEAFCKPAGSTRSLRQQSRCRVVRRAGVPVLLISSRQPLRVRIVQNARGNKRLLPFTRSTDYRYSPKSERAVRLS